MSSIGPPAPPNRPEISKISETGVSITWSDPIDDGGSEVTGCTIHVLNELEEVVITKTCPATVQQLLLRASIMDRPTHSRCPHLTSLGKGPLVSHQMCSCCLATVCLAQEEDLCTHSWTTENLPLNRFRRINVKTNQCHMIVSWCHVIVSWYYSCF